MRLECLRQHVGSIHMRASIIHRSRLSLAVGFDEETTKVGDDFIDFVSFVCPPFSDLRIHRVGRVQFTECLG